MKNTALACAILIGFSAIQLLFGQEILKVGDHKDDRPTLPISVSDYDDSWTKIDTQGSGKIDYAVKYDKSGKKLCEAFSHFLNGTMDDFIFYEDGVPVREEIDTTGIHKVDLWVYFDQGIYVKRFERSTKHDGIIDLVRVFGPQEKANQ